MAETYQKKIEFLSEPLEETDINSMRKKKYDALYGGRQRRRKMTTDL